MPIKPSRKFAYQCDVCYRLYALEYPISTHRGYCDACGSPIYLAVWLPGVGWEILSSPAGRVSAEDVLRATLERAITRYSVEPEEPPF